MCALLFRPNQKVVFIGDSITDCGRRGEPNAPYGAGYMAMVRNFLIARYPGLNLAFENRGISGNTIRDLKARWEEDVIAEQPGVLSVMIGINDVWRILQNRSAEAVHVGFRRACPANRPQGFSGRTRLLRQGLRPGQGELRQPAEAAQGAPEAGRQALPGAGQAR